MSTRSEVLTQYAKLAPFRGMDSTDIGTFLDLALEAVSGYSPKKVKMKSIPATNDSRYNVPDTAITVISAFVTDTNIRIQMREEKKPNGDRTYLLLGIQQPSWLELVQDDVDGYSYPSRYLSTYRRDLLGAGSEKHDLLYSEAVAVEDLEPRQLMALRLYAESQAYEYQATKSENLSDIVDRDPVGASTTLRRSQSGSAFRKLAEDKREDFRREIARPYWATDSFGITEFLWSE